MSFSDLQLRRLHGRLKPQHIRTREANGNILHYIEGWHAIEEANRIIGLTAGTERWCSVAVYGRGNTDQNLPPHPAHLQFIASKPCMVCGRRPSQAHHLTFAQLKALGRKVSDEFAVPLCALHHSELHAAGDERGWWTGKALDPLPIASGFWLESQSTTLSDGTTDASSAK